MYLCEIRLRVTVGGTGVAQKSTGAAGRTVNQRHHISSLCCGPNSGPADRPRPDHRSAGLSEALESAGPRRRAVRQGEPEGGAIPAMGGEMDAEVEDVVHLARDVQSRTLEMVDD